MQCTCLALAGSHFTVSLDIDIEAHHPDSALPAIPQAAGEDSKIWITISVQPQDSARPDVADGDMLVIQLTILFPLSTPPVCAVEGSGRDQCWRLRWHDGGYLAFLKDKLIGRSLTLGLQAAAGQPDQWQAYAHACWIASTELDALSSSASRLTASAHACFHPRSTRRSRSRCPTSMTCARLTSCATDTLRESHTW